MSLIGRAILALVLTVVFYLLALLVGFGLLALPVAELWALHRIHPQIAIPCLVGGTVILLSILPRTDRFVPPGPRLEPEVHPRLFAELCAVATATRQKMPREVYLVSDVNAWVAERGGMMGVGRRRVMGLGLPLLQLLSVPQMRAVLAHEFGHFQGGDTSLGPWIHNTRQAIIRTVVALSQRGSALRHLFVWYGNLFLRITHAVSRRQELAADALAARVVSARALASGLRIIHAAAPAHEAFWGGEVGPVVESGFRPPLVDGFARFIETKSVHTRMQLGLESELANAKVDPYDTHPPLRERLAALGENAPDAPAPATTAAMEPAMLPAAETTAVHLLAEVGVAEEQLISALTGAPSTAFRATAWKDVGEQVYIPNYRKLMERYARVLSGVLAEKVTTHVTSPGILRTAVDAHDRASRSAQDSEAYLMFLLGAAIAVLLHDRGWQAEALPGEPVRMLHAGESVAPMSMLARLKSGEMSEVEWQAWCVQAQIAGAWLGSPRENMGSP